MPHFTYNSRQFQSSSFSNIKNVSFEWYMTTDIQILLNTPEVKRYFWLRIIRNTKLVIRANCKLATSFYLQCYQIFNPVEWIYSKSFTTLVGFLERNRRMVAECSVQSSKQCFLQVKNKHFLLWIHRWLINFVCKRNRC